MKKHIYLIVAFILFAYNGPAQGIESSLNTKDAIVFEGITLSITHMSELLGEKVTWIDCANYCRSLNEGGYNNWRMPSFKEAIYYRTSNLIKVPDKWGNWIWTTTPYDGVRMSAPVLGHYIMFNEVKGDWGDGNYDEPRGCRCIR